MLRGLGLVGIFGFLKQCRELALAGFSPPAIPVPGKLSDCSMCFRRRTEIFIHPLATKTKLTIYHTD